MKAQKSNAGSPTLSSLSDFNQSPLILHQQSQNQIYEETTNGQNENFPKIKELKFGCYQWEKNLEKRINKYLDSEEIDLISPTRKQTNYFSSSLANVWKFGKKNNQHNNIQPLSTGIKLIKLNTLGVGDSKICLKRKEINNNCNNHNSKK